MQVLLGAVTLFFYCCIWLLVSVTVGYNLGQPAEKGWKKKKKKKTLVLTLGNLLKKGERKKKEKKKPWY